MFCFANCFCNFLMLSHATLFILTEQFSFMQSWFDYKKVVPAFTWLLCITKYFIHLVVSHLDIWNFFTSFRSVYRLNFNIFLILNWYLELVNDPVNLFPNWFGLIGSFSWQYSTYKALSTNRETNTCTNFVEFWIICSSLRTPLIFYLYRFCILSYYSFL